MEFSDTNVISLAEWDIRYSILDIRRTETILEDRADGGSERRPADHEFSGSTSVKISWASTTPSGRSDATAPSTCRCFRRQREAIVIFADRAA
ncbi:hypothetical protein C446_01188 [Halobiforma nitratireducens JCM 10879]|uniref:Uncharacterized protein n=1 Tax=Halobiforma nitratireducens JCM 10879 TaxID=1227454 RepID=M0MLA1_9EURY|nr:hypothetical protein C446_01188 [Halobiforma nitratireducens JCM 10879]